MNKFRYDIAGEGVAVVCTALQTNQVYQTISLILTVIGILVSLAYSIWKWFKEAKSDGKITADEIKDISDTTINEIVKIVEEVEKHKESKDKGEK